MSPSQTKIFIDTVLLIHHKIALIGVDFVRGQIKIAGQPFCERVKPPIPDKYSLEYIFTIRTFLSDCTQYGTPNAPLNSTLK